MSHHINKNGRRKFIKQTGKGLITSAFAVPFLLQKDVPLLQTAHSTSAVKDTIPVHLKPLEAASEKQDAPPPAPLAPDKRIGFAIVGLGHLALEQILPAFASAKLCKPVALVSGDSAKAEKVAEQYGIKTSSIYNYNNYDEMAGNKDIQVVYIVLPNSMHKEFTIRAAKAGKHVLCEKPMAVSSAEAKEMIDACKEADKKLMIAYRIQYELNNHLMKQWVRNKTYGNIKIIESFNGQNQGDTDQWRLKKALAGGGALPDIGLYCLNTARYLTGEEPLWVSAQQFSTPGDPRFKEVEESVFFQMGFPDNTIAFCGTSYGVHDNKRYRCYGDSGAWFGMDPAFSYKGLKIEMSAIKEDKEWNEAPKIEMKDQFALEMDHMAQCVMYNQQPFTPGEEGLQDHKIIEAIYKSAKENKMILLDKMEGKDIFRGTVPMYE